MRNSSVLTAIATLLLGGCASVSPPAPVPPAPVVVETPAPEPVEPLEPAVEPQPAPRRQEAVRIDNSSIESFRASFERMRASLSPAQQADLNDAIVELTFADYGDVTRLPPNLRNSPIVPEMVRHRIAGLTYAEIITLAR